MNIQKHYFCFFLILLTATANCFSQAPAIQWENSIGGNGSDIIYCAGNTSDGGYILGASSVSGISVDKSEADLGPFGSWDYWIIKLDSVGNIDWQNTIGSYSNDIVRDIFQLTDGGFMVIGSSYGGYPSGDKTTIDNGSDDFWILKLDASGNILFQKSFGGSGDDIPMAGHQTSDGGFIIGGYSTSGATGNKTEASQGGIDYWVIRLGPSGKLLWQNTIGGSGDDILYDLDITDDGGFILGGYSKSGISGDKTEASMGVGYNDYWVVKLDSSGMIQWQNTIGGNFEDYLHGVRLTPDGGYILAGRSNSGISGDKSESSLGAQDVWIVKLNSDGTIQWENTLGELTGNEVWSVENTADGGFILGGGYSYWVCKLNADGTVDWDEQFSPGSDIRSVIQTSDQGYLIAGWSGAGIGAGKSEPNFGAEDLWIVKLHPDFCVPATEICNAMDDNCNGMIDDGVVESISISAAGPTTFCQGNSVILNATFSGTSLQWKKDGVNIPGAISSTYTATAKATYSCTTTSACGSATSTGIYINVQKNPTALITAGGPTTFCPGGSVTLTETPSAGCTYQWYKGASAIAGAITNIYSATESGNYKCLVTKTATGCSKNSNKIVVVVSCREDGINNKQFSIYPNPASNLLTVFSPQSSDRSADASIIITDLSGKMIFQNDLISSETIIDVSDYAAGIYFVKMMINGNTITKKLIIEH